MNRHMSKGELVQALSPAWQSRTDSSLLNQFFKSKAGERLRKVALQHLSNHRDEILSRYDSVEEAREQFAADQLHSEIPTIFLCFGNTHDKFCFFFTFSSSEIIR